MAGAVIILQQSGDNNLTPGSRDNLILSAAVTVLNQNNADIISWLWTIIDKPSGSVASLVSPTSSTTTFIPDITGTYLIKLVINGTTISDQKGAAVKTSNLHYRIPAAKETTEFDATRGWATAINAALTTLDVGGGGSGPTGAIGDLPYFATTTNTLSRLADVATGKVLHSGGVGVAPSYSSVAGTDFASQSANVVFAGPTTSTATPTFRTLVAGDIPSLSTVYLPLAGGTMTGSLLFTDNTLDIGANGATRPRTLYMGTSAISPLFTNLITAIGTVQTIGTSIQNTTGAALNAQQFSPVLEFKSDGWGTSGGATQTVKLGIQQATVQGTVASNYLSLLYTATAGNATLTEFGQILPTGGGITIKSDITMSGTASGTIFDSKNALTAGDNALNLLNAAAAFMRFGLRGTPAGAGPATTTPGIYAPQTATALAVIAPNSGGYDSGIEINRGGDASVRVWMNGTNYVTFGIGDVSPAFHDNVVTLGTIGSAWNSIASYTVISQHYKGSGTTPTGVLGTGANQGTGSSITIVGNDTAGTIEIHTGSGAPISTVMATITFNATYTVAPSAVILSAADDRTASDELQSTFKAFATTVTATTFLVVIATAGTPTVSTTYKWFYHVLG